MQGFLVFWNYCTKFFSGSPLAAEGSLLRAPRFNLSHGSRPRLWSCHACPTSSLKIGSGGCTLRAQGSGPPLRCRHAEGFLCLVPCALSILYNFALYKRLTGRPPVPVGNFCSCHRRLVLPFNFPKCCILRSSFLSFLDLLSLPSLKGS